MKTIKKTFTILALVIIIIASVAVSFNILTKKPCDTPVTYRIGTLSDKFKINQSDFLKAMSEAGDLWNKALGKQIIKYDTQGKVTVNLVYDARQSATDQTKVFQSNIGVSEQSAQLIKFDLDAVKLQYKEAKATYDSDLASFESKGNDLSSQISYWNSKGGTPKSEYDKLTIIQNDLKATAVNLETERLNVNSLANQADSLVQKYNNFVKNINSNVTAANKLSDKEFEQGQYSSGANGEEINVYQFDDRVKLVRVLAHEFGHAIGLGHNDDPSSIMYYLDESKELKLSDADIKSLKLFCEIK